MTETSATAVQFPVIAIDGYSCSGKGTISRMVADSFNFFYLDTGLLYRALACGLIAKDGVDEPLKYFDEIDIFDIVEHKDRNYLKGEQVGYIAAKIASNRNIRARLLSLQRELAKHPPTGYKGSVLDGRDIGTVVFPKAFCKFFFQADPEVRAMRRFLQLNKSQPYEEILDLLNKRDLEDTSRDIAPLKYDKDIYILIDTTNMTEEETLHLVKEYIIQKAKESNIDL